MSGPGDGALPEVPGGQEAAAEAPHPLSDLERQLRELPSAELLELLEREAARLSPGAARQALANPFVTAEAVELLASQSRLLSFYEVRRDIARHARAPQHVASRFVPGLYWRDLLSVSLDSRIHPRIRREADLCLGQRAGELSVGEKVSLARRASPTLIGQLRHDPSPRVFAALLDNPRLTEGLLAPLAHSDKVSAAVLEVLASDRRWGCRYDLRLAIARNPHARPETAMRLLVGLRKSDLRAVANDPRLGAAVRRRARLLLGEGPG
jgi:hypothetical protein